MLCKALCMNMTDHIKNTHRISKSDPKYNQYIMNSDTIPKCYTKHMGNKRVQLSGEELKEAKKKYESDISTQNELLNNLKELRKRISSLEEKLKSSSGEIAESTKKMLQSAKSEYAALRQVVFKVNRKFFRMIWYEI